MNLFFVICTVFGVTLLSCVTLLSVLGLDEKPDFVDQDWNSGYEELSGLASTDISQQSGIDLPVGDVSKNRYQRSSLRGLGAGIAFFGLTGSAAHAIHMSFYQTVGLSFLAGIVAFLGVGLLMRQLPFDPFKGSFSEGTSDEHHNFPPAETEIADIS